MTSDQIKWITDAAEADLRLTLSEREITQAMLWMSELTAILTAEYYAEKVSLGVLLYTNNLPIADKRFPTLLRVFANVLELKIEIDKREEKE